MFYKTRKYDPRSMAFSLADSGSRIGSLSGEGRGAVDAAVPEPHGIRTSDAYLGLEVNGAKWDFHASQPVSLNMGVDSPSSFMVILQGVGSGNC